MLNELEKVASFMYQLSVVLPKQIDLGNIIQQMDRHCVQPYGLAERPNPGNVMPIKTEKKSSGQKKQTQFCFSFSFTLLKVKEVGLSLKGTASFT